MRINLECIREWMEISDEELMERLVKDAIGLQEEAKERERQAIAEKRMHDRTYNMRTMRKTKNTKRTSKGEKPIAGINLDYIKKWIKISDEELMERLVKDAVELRKEARKREHHEACMHDPTYNAAFIREFFVNYSFLHDYFSDEEILTACMRHAAASDIVKEVTVRGWQDEASLGDRFVEYTRAKFPECRYGRVYTVEDDATIVLAPNPDQYAFAKKIIKELLLKKLPYLKDFAVDFYSGIYKKDDDFIYIRNPEKTKHNCDAGLYISVGDLLSHKTGTELLKSHKDYLHKCSNGKCDDATEKFLASPFVQSFLAAAQEFADQEEN